jgi:hypothetical protein
MKNRKQLLLWLLCMFFTLTGYGQIQFQNDYYPPASTATPPIISWDGANCIRQDSKKNYFVSGYYNNIGSNAYIEELNQTGTLQWRKTFSASKYFEEVIDPNDNVVAVGEQGGQIVVNNMGPNATGGSGAFNLTYPISNNGSGHTIDISVNSTGSFDGYIVGGQTNFIPTLFKIGTSGIVSWSKTLANGSAKGTVLAVRHTADKGYIAAMTISSSRSTIILAKLDNSGTVSWQKSYNLGILTTPSFSADSIRLIQTDDDNNGVKDNGYAIASGSTLLKIDGLGVPTWFMDSLGITTASLCQDDNDKLNLVGPSGSLMQIDYSSTPTMTIFKSYTTAGELYDIIETADHGYACVGHASSMGANPDATFVVKLYPNITGGSSCASGSTYSLRTASITPGSTGLTVLPAGLTASTATLGASNVTSMSTSSVCSLTCTAPSTPTISANCSTKILTATCSSPGVDFSWYDETTSTSSGTGSTFDFSSNPGHIYHVTASYGSCSSSSASFSYSVATPTISVSNCSPATGSTSARLTANCTTPGVTYVWHDVTTATTVTDVSHPGYIDISNNDVYYVTAGFPISCDNNKDSKKFVLTPSIPTITEGTQTVCNIPLTASCTTPDVDFTWYTEESSTPISTLASITANDDSKHYYVVASNSGCNSTSSASTTFANAYIDGTNYLTSYQYQKSYIRADHSSSGCSTLLTAKYSIGAVDPTNYEWFYATDASSTFTSLGSGATMSSISVDDAGLYKVVESFGSSSCMSTSVPYEVLEEKPTISSTGSTCQSLPTGWAVNEDVSFLPSVTLTANLDLPHGVLTSSVNSTGYTWLYRPGLSGTFAVWAPGGGTYNTNQITTNALGQYMVMYTYTSSSGGCQSYYSDIYTNSFKDPGVLDYSIYTDCGGTAPEVTCKLNDPTTNFFTPITQATWTILNSSGTVITSQTLSGNNATNEFSYTSSSLISGTYTVKLKWVDGYLCDDHSLPDQTFTLLSGAPEITSITDDYPTYSSISCGTDHTITLTATNLENTGQVHFKSAGVDIAGVALVGAGSWTGSTFTGTFKLPTLFWGALAISVRNSTCLTTSNSDKSLTIAYAMEEPQIPKGTASPLEVCLGTPAFKLIDNFTTKYGAGVVPTLPSYTFSQTLGTTLSSTVFYHNTCSSCQPDYMFDASSSNAITGSFQFTPSFAPSSTASPAIRCSTTIANPVTITVFSPSVSVSNAVYCPTNKASITLTIGNIPTYDVVTVYLFDANNQPLYSSGNPAPTFFSISSTTLVANINNIIPTSVGNTFYYQLKVHHFYNNWLSDALLPESGPITLTGAIAAQQISMQYKYTGGNYASVSGSIPVCFASASTFPVLQATVTPGNANASVPSYTYQWYDGSNNALANPTGSSEASGTIPATSCSSPVTLPEFNSADFYSSPRPFTLTVTEVSSGPVTLCGGGTSTTGGCNCPISNTVNYTDNAPSSTSITSSSTYFCGSTVTLTATSNSSYTYQWEEYVNGVWSSDFSFASGGGTNALDINHPGTYHCIITNASPSGASCPATSNDITITAPVLSIEDFAPSAPYSTSSSSLNVSTSVSSYFSGPYQWYYVSPTGTGATALAGATSVPLSFSGSSYSPGYYYLKGNLSTCGSGDVVSNVVYISGSCSTVGMFPLSTTTSVGSSYFSNSNFSVTGGSMTVGGSAATTYIYMGSGTSITVPSGSTLTLEKVSVTCCSGMWQGIVVQGGGSLIIKNGCTITNATCGVYSDNGGAVDISGSTFQQNVNHIALADYTSSTLSVNIHGNTFGNLVTMPGLSTSFFYKPLKNASYNKMIYISNVPYGLSNSIASNTFDNYIPTINGSGISGIEVYHSGASGVITFNANTFGGSGTSFAREIYAEGGSSSSSITGNLTFTNNSFYGNNSGSGIVLNDVEGCSITGSITDHNTFENLQNGVEYYQNYTVSTGNAIELAHFEQNTYAIVAATGSHPVLVGSNNNVSVQLALQMSCNKIVKNTYGIIGSGDLQDQGDASTDAGNNFNTASGTHCTTCSSQNTEADILWIGDGTNRTNYYASTDYSSTINTSTTTTSVSINGTTQSSSGNGFTMNSILSSASSCWASFKMSGLSSKSSAKELKLYPNPTSAFFTIELPHSEMIVNYSLQVMDITGRKIYNCSTEKKPTETIDASTWPSGTYYITIVSETGDVYNVKAVKQQ